MPLIDLKTNLKDLKYGHDQYDGASSIQPFVSVKVPPTEDPLNTNYTPSNLFDFNVNGEAGVSLKKDKYLTTVLLVGGTLLGAGIGLGLGLGSAIGAGLELSAGAALGAAGAGALAGALVTTGGLIFTGGIGVTGGSLDVSYPSFSPISGTGYTDFLVRGGMLLPSIVVKDAVRMSRFLSSQNGLFFILKQQLLSRVSVRPEYAGPGFTLGFFNEGGYNPVSTILGAVGAPFGLHPNKQGNPVLGLFSDFTPNRYYSYITDDNFKAIEGNKAELKLNRLYSLYNIKLLEDSYDSSARRNDVASSKNFILNYGGGPGSVLGIGRTRIPYGTDQYNHKLTINTVGRWDSQYGYDLKQLGKISDRTHYGNSTHKATILNVEDTIIKAYLDTQVYKLLGDPGNPAQKLNREELKTQFLIGYDYKSEKPKSYGAASPSSYDKITALPIYRGGKSDNLTPDNFSDLVNFYIASIDNGTGEKDYMHFRAFLNSVNDNYESNWNPIKYVGRGENFYTYNGFDRKISLSWTVVAQSLIELRSMYKKLNYLASLCAPDYGESGYMRANIIELNIGNYINDQPGIINRVSYEISEDSTWDIDNQLPHMIKVQFDFTPIHNFVPRKQQNKFDESGQIIIPNEEGDSTTGYGKEYFINNDSENESSEQDLTLYNATPLSDTPSNNDINDEANTPKLSKLQLWWARQKTIIEDRQDKRRINKRERELNKSYKSLLKQDEKAEKALQKELQNYSNSILTIGEIINLYDDPEPSSETDDIIPEFK